MKVPRGFESHPLRRRVSDAEKLRLQITNCPRARRLLSQKSRREISIAHDVATIGEILSISTFRRGLWSFASGRERARGLEISDQRDWRRNANLFGRGRSGVRNAPVQPQPAARSAARFGAI